MFLQTGVRGSMSIASTFPESQFVYHYVFAGIMLELHAIGEKTNKNVYNINETKPIIFPKIMAMIISRCYSTCNTNFIIPKLLAPIGRSFKTLQSVAWSALIIIRKKKL